MMTESVSDEEDESEAEGQTAEEEELNRKWATGVCAVSYTHLTLPTRSLV